MITAKEIKEAREKANISQVELAVRAGVSVEAIRRWEQGGGSPKPENEKRLKAVFKRLGGAGHGKSSKTDRPRT